MENKMTYFFNEAWFWTSFFVLIGSLGGIFITGLLTAKSQLKVERLRLHEQESFESYKKLYNFISRAENIIFPLDEPRLDFITVMKNAYLKDVKHKMLFFTPEIRKILYNFESQYDALGNSDLHPKVSFDVFMDKHIFKSLESLRKMIEKETDSILH
jgi:hypothetical protein